jgi:hypothetical protein
MFKFAAGMAMVAVSLFMQHGPRASVSQPLQLPDTNLWQLAMGGPGNPWRRRSRRLHRTKCVTGTIDGPGSEDASTGPNAAHASL